MTFQRNKLCICVVENLNLPKMTSGLCPQLLPDNLCLRVFASQKELFVVKALDHMVSVDLGVRSTTWNHSVMPMSWSLSKNSIHQGLGELQWFMILRLFYDILMLGNWCILTPWGEGNESSLHTYYFSLFCLVHLFLWCILICTFSL